MPRAGRVYVILLVGIFMVSGALAMVVATFQRQLATLSVDVADSLIRHVTAVETERTLLDEALRGWLDAGGQGEFGTLLVRRDAFKASLATAANGFAGAGGLPSWRVFLAAGREALSRFARDARALKERDPAAHRRVHSALAEMRPLAQQLVQEALARAAVERKRDYLVLRTSMWQAVALFSGIFLIWAAISTTLHLEKRKVSQLRDELEDRVERRTRQLAQKNSELEQANESLRQFAFVASHDLQEPLRKIKTFASVLDGEIDASASGDARHALGVIANSADRLRALVSDLLAYSRVNNHALHVARTDLAVIVGEVLQDLSVQIAEAGAEIAVGELPAIKADATQVRQLLQNLIGNALKYRAKDRPCRIDIAAAPGRRPGETVLEVRDNGIGFAPDKAQKILEPFQRLHRAADYSGTGIGLAICARIAERHGWRLAADGRPGEGATFRVMIGERAVGTPSASIASAA